MFLAVVAVLASTVVAYSAAYPSVKDCVIHTKAYSIAMYATFDAAGPREYCSALRTAHREYYEVVEHCEGSQRAKELILLFSQSKNQVRVTLELCDMVFVERPDRRLNP